MGIPIGFPKLFFHVLSVFDFIRRLAIVISWSLNADVVNPNPTTDESPDSEVPSRFMSLWATLTLDALPVAKFSSLPDPKKLNEDGCMVCMHEFEDEDEVRIPAKCRHVFHRACLDRWIGYEQMTCPVCRGPVIPKEVQNWIEDRVWVDGVIKAANAYPALYQPYDDDTIEDYNLRIPEYL